RAITPRAEPSSISVDRQSHSAFTTNDPRRRRVEIDSVQTDVGNIFALNQSDPQYNALLEVEVNFYIQRYGNVFAVPLSRFELPLLESFDGFLRQSKIKPAHDPVDRQRSVLLNRRSDDNGALIFGLARFGSVLRLNPRNDGGRRDAGTETDAAASDHDGYLTV